MPELTVVAEDDLPSGEHLIVRAGGSAEDYYTFLETVHPDRHRDEGGMGGPLLYSGSHLNTSEEVTRACAVYWSGPTL